MPQYSISTCINSHSHYVPPSARSIARRLLRGIEYQAPSLPYTAESPLDTAANTGITHQSIQKVRKVPIQGMTNFRIGALIQLLHTDKSVVRRVGAPDLDRPAE